MLNRLLNTPLCLVINKNNYKYKFIAPYDVDTALLRIFLDYDNSHECSPCKPLIASTPQTVRCYNISELHDLSNTSEIEYMDYPATAVGNKRNIVFTLDKKVLQLPPARRLASLIINNTCCQTLVIDTFVGCSYSTLDLDFEAQKQEIIGDDPEC
jgi:hypothetical protein